MENCRKLQFSAFIWDNGYGNNYLTYDDIFWHLKRKELQWENEELIKEYIKAGQWPLEENPDIFTSDPEEKFNTQGMVIDHGQVFFDVTVTSK